jgi:hypothetical protein
VVPEPTQQRLHQGLIAQEALPGRVVEIGGDDGVILRLQWYGLGFLAADAGNSRPL